MSFTPCACCCVAKVIHAVSQGCGYVDEMLLVRLRFQQGLTIRTFAKEPKQLWDMQ